jgi:protein-disulfide isomerase
MSPTRRLALGLVAGAALAGPARAQPAASWFDLRDDRGGQVPNLRLPNELVDEIGALPGVLFVGAKDGPATIFEFHDYNCPWCRAASKDIHALVEAMPELRIGLVGNAILSAGSVQAAKVEIAVLKTMGPEKAWEFQRRLYAEPGVKDGPKALAVAEALGAPRATIESRADSDAAAKALQRQVRLTASLGLNATPSFVLGNTGILGWPGPRALARMIEAVDSCDKPRCS